MVSFSICVSPQAAPSYIWYFGVRLWCLCSLLRYCSDAGSAVVGILALTAFVYVYSRRMAAEEAMLLSQEGYKEYMARTQRLVPFVY